MNLAEIKQLNIMEPSCFESSQEEEWYECGLCHGAQIAEEELINKACDAYCKVCGHYHRAVPYHRTVPTNICRQDCNYYKQFEKLLKQEPDCIYSHTPNKPQITIGTKIRSKASPDIILSIISDDCHEDEFECSNGSVLSLKQIEKYYDIIIV